MDVVSGMCGLNVVINVYILMESVTKVTMK